MPRQHPFSIPMKDYSGRDPKKRAAVGEINAAARQVQGLIDERMRRCSGPEAVTFEALPMARKLGLDTQIVRDVLSLIGEGEGVLVYVGDLDKALEKRSMF
jgi:hypothetical protein